MGELLKGKSAVVTGSGRGIGQAIVKLMAAEGAKVVVNDLGVNLDGTGTEGGPADQTVAEIKAAGGVAVANKDNIATKEGSESLIKTAVSNFGRIDIVVNCAGILRDKMIHKMEWEAVNPMIGTAANAAAIMILNARLSMGPPQTESALREALTYGADQARLDQEIILAIQKSANRKGIPVRIPMDVTEDEA